MAKGQHQGAGSVGATGWSPAGSEEDGANSTQAPVSARPNVGATGLS